MNKNPDSILNEIANKLAINYFNVSLRKSEDNDRDLMTESNLKRIFSKKLPIRIEKKNKYKEFKFNRNILIVGAGASKADLSFFSTGSEAIEKIEESLGLPKLLKNNYFKKKYRSLANHYFKTVYDDSVEINEIKKQLKFEGRLSLLLNFFNKQDVLYKIDKVLNYPYFFSYYYDIIAHLLKHRFIDVIVNFNFDEMLDNSIEEELGASGMYHKIVHDSDCKPIGELMESHRLKVPIYVKPHGTISSKTSLLFTKEQYIDISEDMKNVLHSIFTGKVGLEGGNSIGQINVLVAGFAMESIELNNILFSLQLKENKKDVSYYLFNTKPEEVEKLFLSNLVNWMNSKGIKDYIKPSVKGIVVGEIKDGKFSQGENRLSNHFEKLHKLIQSRFNKPFTPIGLNVHKITSLLFPQEKLAMIGDGLLKKNNTANFQLYKDYIINRFVFHILYEIIKWKGKLAINVAITERAGKYFRQYVKLLEVQSPNTSPRVSEFPDIIGYLEDRLSIQMSKTGLSPDNIYEWQEIAESKSKEKCIREVLDKMINNSLINKTLDNKLRNDIRRRLEEDVYDSKRYEISPLYNDIRHSRFRYFSHENIIHTSLNLTYKFFEYSVLRREKNKGIWDEMWFSSESGTPIFNLHRYCDLTRDPSYLEKIGNENKQIRLLFSDDSNIEVDLKSKRDGKGLEIKINKLLFDLLKENIEMRKLDSYINMHHMALFIKNGEPVYGFYFFRPEAKNRINPVWFEANKDTNSGRNLLHMKELFKDQWAKGRSYDT